MERHAQKQAPLVLALSCLLLLAPALVSAVPTPRSLRLGGQQQHPPALKLTSSQRLIDSAICCCCCNPDERWVTLC
ncbi:uncharacterized protein [Zea mays]|uniref:uncharacterized protein isoform X2 n=1 Tax=Zea mays TaxID=4577 RepID=UPI0009A98F76|nr:uncharacterized protein LOC100277571 isoform X2 [Zea mays]|eukprot:XP_020397610.1 uncharacterized protein LOC100277571 isoform X2 [Zea mays]